MTAHTLRAASRISERRSGRNVFVVSHPWCSHWLVVLHFRAPGRVVCSFRGGMRML